MYTRSMLRKSTIALGATLTLVGSMIALPSVALAAPGDAVTIPDTNLRAAVKAAVGHQADNTADPTEAEMATITNLDLSGRQVTNLAGIQYATGLTSLNLTGNAVADIAPLTTLPSLANLDLSFTPVSSIAPLSGKASISSLNLSNTESSEADAETTFASLPNLDGLNVSNSNLGEEVAYATSVIELNINDNSMTNLDGYEALTNLRSLSAANNPLENLDGLKGRDLDYLDVGISKVRDLSGITAQSGQVVSEVPLSAGVGEAVDATVLGVGTTGSLPVETGGNGTYDPADGTITYTAAGDYIASWNQTSGETFVFSGNLSVGVANTAPSAVSDFEASGRVGSVNLRWATPNANGLGDIESYTVEVSNDGFVTRATVTLPGTATSTTIDNLNGGNYTARITYKTTSGAVSPESSTAVRIYGEPFAAPTGLGAAYQTSTGNLTFSWQGVGAPSYILTVTNDRGREFTYTVPDNTLLRQSFTLPASELLDTYRYTFKVEAGDDEGSLGNTSDTTVFNPWTNYVGPLTATTPASNIRVESYNPETGRLTLAWDAPTDAERFSYRLVGEGGASDYITDRTVELNVVPGEDYVFELASRNATSSYAAAAPFAVEVPGLASVTGITADLGEDNAVLNWNPVLGATGYEVVVLGEAMTQPTRTDVTGTTATVNFADFAEENEQFEIGVRAKGVNGSFGDFSTILFVNPGADYAGPATATLPAVTNLDAEYDEATQSFVATWAGDEDADRFVVNFNGVDMLLDGNETSISLPAGAPGAVQDITVYQRGVGGAYGPGATVSVTTPEDVPVVPGSLTGTVDGENLLVTWPEIPGAVAYAVTLGNIEANNGNVLSIYDNEAALPGYANETFVLSLVGEDADGNVIPGVAYSGIWNAGGTEFLDITAPPAAVENGRVTLDTDTVNVTWDSNGADFYRVIATNGELGRWESPLLADDVTSYEFDRSQFPAGSTWTFTVVARDASSVFSAPAEADVTFPADSGNGGGAGEGEGGAGNPGAGEGAGGSGAGAGAEDGAPTAAGSETDPIKNSGEGDLSLIFGGAMVLGGSALLLTPLIRRRKGLAGENAA